MSLNYLYKMNTNQIKALQPKCKLAFIPIGPTEVHSQHLPLFTDVESALEGIERTAEKLQVQGIESLIASPINYTLANVANVFTGNTTLRYETVVAIVEDVCVSLAKWGFNNIVVVCGHCEPANMEAMAEGCRKAHERDGSVNAMVSQWLFEGIAKAAPLFKCEHPEWDLHAGESETGVMLIRHPELVDMDMLAKLEPNWEGEFLNERMASGITNFIDAGAPLAYFGDPRSGSAEGGAKIYNALADYIVEEVHTLMK